MIFLLVLIFYPKSLCCCFPWEKTWHSSSYLPGPSRRLPPVIKCRRFLSFFQRYIVRNISLTEMYRKLLTNLIRHFEKQEAWRTVKRKIIAFWGTTRSPTFKVQWYPLHEPKSLFKFGEKKDQLCAVALVNRRWILRVLFKMVAMAASHSHWRFYLIALTPTTPALLQNKIWFSNKHIL